jgi:CubicO group peptidase (beta-lactamase class C family)
MRVRSAAFPVALVLLLGCGGHIRANTAAPPKLLAFVQPEYPPSLQASGVRATLYLAFVVDTLGSIDPRSLHITTDADPAFAEALRAVLPRWRYEPGSMDGRKLPVLVTQTVTFDRSPDRAPDSSDVDDLEQFIRGQIASRQIPGLSLAIIQNGEIVAARGYGMIERGGAIPVTTATLFQAGSISKSVTALAALRLVEKGRLALDTNVNSTLRSWKVPDNRFTVREKVTLRRILSHTAGLTVHGFPGYATDDAIPTLVQVLDGAKPANTEPIRVDTFPGSIWRYSGGGYTVLQQMLLDVTGKPFPEFMSETVLSPIRMTSSTYQQPLPADRARLSATGHYEDRSLVRGRWHIYPEMAAAGLWTTPSDLARFAIEIERTLAGKSHAVISQSMARQMLTDQKDGDGLGVFLRGSGASLRFGHNGRDEGFDALLVAYPKTGQGVAIMINANDDSHMMDRILNFIGQKYHWPDAGAPPPSVPPRVAADPLRLQAYAGRYELHNNQMITLAANDSGLASLVGGFPDEIFLSVGTDSFASIESNVRFSITKDSAGLITGLAWHENGADRQVPRLGPLIKAFAEQADPDPALTARILITLSALAEGGPAVAQAKDLTDGARRDFGSAGPWQALKGARSLSYLGVETVKGRGVERHGGQVDRVLYYGVETEAGRRYIMVHLTAAGTITDFDMVDD